MASNCGKIPNIAMDFGKGSLVGGAIGGGAGVVVGGVFCTTALVVMGVIAAGTKDLQTTGKWADGIIPGCYVEFAFHFAYKGALICGSANALRGIATRFFLG